MANIFEFLSKDGNVTPEKARKSRQMQFRDKTAYVWGLRYRWDPSLSRIPDPRIPHFMPPCIWYCPSKQWSYHDHHHHCSREPCSSSPSWSSRVGQSKRFLNHGKAEVWPRWWRWSGLHKLWYPGIRDMSTWSKFGAHGEHGDVFLFSNLGALWFSENLIRHKLHICLRFVKNNFFSFKHPYLRHFSWRF